MRSFSWASPRRLAEDGLSPSRTEPAVPSVCFGVNKRHGPRRDAKTSVDAGAGEYHSPHNSRRYGRPQTCVLQIAYERLKDICSTSPGTFSIVTTSGSISRISLAKWRSSHHSRRQLLPFGYTWRMSDKAQPAKTRIHFRGRPPPVRPPANPPLIFLEECVVVRCVWIFASGVNIHAKSHLHSRLLRPLVSRQHAKRSTAHTLGILSRLFVTSLLPCYCPRPDSIPDPSFYICVDYS